MRLLKAALLLVICLTLFASVSAESEFGKKLNSDYDLLHQDLLNNTGEYAEVSNFIYQKDVATFTFSEGIIHLLRYVDDRPTTAIFVGKGKATIQVPVHTERLSLFTVARDSIVDTEFETCFIRFADDFDLKLKEQLTFEPKQLSWKNFNIAAKKGQGEVYFKPTIYHTYDNYFQLLRSCNERGPDGYFWIDFERYIFTFDPNRPEQVCLAYEFQAADVEATEGALFQRRENNVYADSSLSQISFPTTMLDRRASIEMGGIDGKLVDAAEATVKVRVDADSLRFVSLFLDYNLKVDSIYYNGSPVDYIRRKDFDFSGIVLPAYARGGDTLTFTLWYHGRQFDHALPWVENPAPTPYHLTMTTQKDFNYFMPGMGPIEEIEGGRQRFTVTPTEPYNAFYWAPYSGGLDTLVMTSQSGMSLGFLVWDLMSKKYSDCFIPHDLYQETTLAAFDFLSGILGNPPNAFAFYVSPSGTFTMPGVMCVPQITCVREEPMLSYGGFHAVAGREAARQWFGATMKPATERELWISAAAPEYVNLVFLQGSLGTPAYANLINRRDTVYTIVENKRDRPLVTGTRADISLRSNKGLWVIHMLRFLMYDIDSGSEDVFFRFLRELSLLCNIKSFTNQDIIDLAEKHYGESLDWFFKYWLYGINYPEYEVKYSVVNEGGQYYIDATVKTEKVPAEFKMPVMLRVATVDGRSQFLRQTISGAADSFRLGPYDVEPEELVFNEFYSVLCKSKVDKK